VQFVGSGEPGGQNQPALHATADVRADMPFDGQKKPAGHAVAADDAAGQ
jgi:hypothetical protein